ncbi:MAG TPA: DM13 domain-containing protein [Actinomycetota bacterium]|nr:DM13 domain-containing protein [Actinomycetota bacterium]
MKRSHRRRRTIIVAVVAGLLAGAAGVAWFQPQKLLINQRVDEALPLAATPTSGALDTSLSRPGTRPSGLEPTILSTSLFRSLGHATSGRAVTLELADGRRFLRLVDLHTSNGPDLFVYLSRASVEAPRETFDDDFVSLGRLRANQGNQNYAIPGGVPLDRYQSVVIWCRRFTYAFGAAALG